MKIVTIYTKPYCSLCHKAEMFVRSVQAETTFQIDLIDITQDAQLLARHQYDIPVILVNGVEFCRHRIDPGRLRRALIQ